MPGVLRVAPGTEPIERSNTKHIIVPDHHFAVDSDNEGHLNPRITQCIGRRQQFIDLVSAGVIVRIEFRIGVDRDLHVTPHGIPHRCEGADVFDALQAHPWSHDMDFALHALQRL